MEESPKHEIEIEEVKQVEGSNEIELKVETTKLGEQEASGQELEVEQETKEEDISQGTTKQELEIKIKEKVDSTTMVEQEALWALGQKVEIKVEEH